MSRPLREDEKRLLAALLEHARLGTSQNLDALLVQDMGDGGMGSIRCVGSRRFSHSLVEAEYTDEDGVLISIVLGVDENERFWELDFWKINFSPLRRYPQVEQLRVGRDSLAELRW